MDDLFSTPSGSGWLLSGQDRRILGDLHKVLRCWLPCFETSERLAKAVKAIAAIEALARDGTPPEFFEISITRRAERSGGLSAEVTLTDFDISLSLTEWVWIGVQGWDYGTPTDSQGRAICLSLTRDGSFEQRMFETWWHEAMSLAPEGPNDFSSKAEISGE